MKRSFEVYWPFMLSKIEKAFRRITLSQELITAGFVLVCGLLVAASWYGYSRLTTLSRQVALLDAELVATTNLIGQASSTLADALLLERQNIENKLGSVEDKVGSISGTVTDLQKLSKIDPELLAKYSKVFFLSDNYAPAQLIDIPTEYKYTETQKLQVIPQILPYLKRMLDDAKDDGVPLYVQSAYRSFATQSALKGQYTVVYGAGTANQFSADQGYSEHQLGSTLDFITTGLGGQLTGFENTPAYDWLLENAYRYGFIISYPKNNGYYIFEPWHWRFVGEKLAKDLHASGAYFYSMDQRTIDTYLISLFD